MTSKQRHAAKRIFERLREEGNPGSYPPDLESEAVETALARVESLCAEWA